MHVHQQQSQTYKTGELPALREVNHPHRDRTSMNRSPSTEQKVLSQFSGYSEEIEHFTRDPRTTQLKSCFQLTTHAPKKPEVNTCINCEHSYRHMDDHLTQNTGRMQQQHLQNKTSNSSHAEFPPGMENTPAILGKQFLQGKEKITCPDMENIPVLLWNQSIQGNEKNVDTCTFTPGSTTPSNLCSAYPHIQGKFHRISNNWRRKVPTQWHFQASTTMLRQPHMYKLPEIYTAMEHYPPVSKWTLTCTLTWTLTIQHTDTDIQGKKSTFFQNHQNSDHLRQWHTDTQGKKPTFFQDHLNSNRLRTQKLRSSIQHTSSIQDKNTANSQKQKKAKFQIPFTYNDDRNFVRHNSVDKFSPNLVFMTTQNTAFVSNSVFCRKKGRKRGRCRDSRNCGRCTCRRTSTCSHTGDSP